jgi:1-acyl-sn-glycerol-3-phosphate acyltransferase
MDKLLKKIWRSFFWKLNRHIVPFLIRAKYGHALKIEGDKLPKAPFIMVANHANFLDPWIVCHICKKPVAIMMNQDGFKASSFQKWYLNNIGAFPKKKGLSDIVAMKKSILAIKNGYPLMVFPEGQTSWDGETQPIYTGIEKMAQKLNVALVMIRMEGNFLARPWWADFNRKGPISIVIKVIKTAEVKQKTADELRNEIISHIKNNDVEKSKDKKFIGENLTAGMKNLIWICPICGAKEKLLFIGNKIVCEKCENEFVFNANLWLENPGNDVANLYEWVKLQKNLVRDCIKNAKDGEILCENDKIRLIQSDYKGRVTTLDIGKLKISKEKFVFFGDSATIEIPTGDIVAPVFQQKNIIQFEYPDGELKFMFLNRPMMKTLYFLRELTGYLEIEERGYFL